MVRGRFSLLPIVLSALLLAFPAGSSASGNCGKVAATGGQRLTVIIEELTCKPALRVMRTYFARVRNGGCAKRCRIEGFTCVRGRNPDELGTHPDVTCTASGHRRVVADDLD